MIAGVIIGCLFVVFSYMDKGLKGLGEEKCVCSWKIEKFAVILADNN